MEEKELAAGSGASAVARKTVGFASLANRRGSYRARILDDGRIGIQHNGLPIWIGQWQPGHIDIPPGILAEEDRELLLARLRKSVAAAAEIALYHYRPLGGLRHGTAIVEESVTIIREEAFYFSDPRDFDDQSDCRLECDLNLTPAEEESFLRWWLREDFAGDQLEVQVLLHLFAQTLRLQFDRIYGPRIERSAFGSRVLCLTTQPDNPFMWANYAAQHTGVCFELGLPADDDGPLAAAPVAYRQTRRIKLCPVPLAMAQAVFLTKAERYRMEDEYRCIDLAGDEPLDDRLRRMKDCVRGMILGPAVNDRDRNIILDAAREYRPQMAVRQASFSCDGGILLLPLSLDR